MRIAEKITEFLKTGGIGWLPFRFKGLATKIYVAFLLAAAIPTSIAGLVGIFFSLETLKRETLVNLEQETAGRAEALTRFFDQLSSEIRIANPAIMRLS